jgi:hypothetical protein
MIKRLVTLRFITKGAQTEGLIGLEQRGSPGIPELPYILSWIRTPVIISIWFGMMKLPEMMRFTTKKGFSRSLTPSLNP